MATHAGVNVPRVLQTPPAAPPLLDRVVETTERLTFRERLELADLLAKSDVFPTAKTQAKALAAIEIGRSLGMHAAEALMSIEFGAQGKPSISVHWQAAQLQRLGYSWQFLTHTAETCHMQFYRKGTACFAYKFTMDEARKIPVSDRQQGEKGATLANKWNYRTWSKEMLYAYIVRRVVRWHEPRILGGYAGTEEEDIEEQAQLGVYEPTRETQKTGEEHRQDLFGDPQPARLGGIPEGVDPVTGEVLEPAGESWRPTAEALLPHLSGEEYQGFLAQLRNPTLTDGQGERLLHHMRDVLAARESASDLPLSR